MRVFGLCVVGSGVDGALVDGGCEGGADIGVVAGPGVFDDGGAAVVPVAEWDDETTGESDGESTGGAVAGRATGTVCGVLGA